MVECWGWDAECSLCCPSQAGTEGFGEHCKSPQIRMSIHSINSLVNLPRIWGKRGSQVGFEWKLILLRRQGEGRQRREQPPALSKGIDNILYLAASWRQLPKPSEITARTPLCLKGFKEAKKSIGFWGAGECDGDYALAAFFPFSYTRSKAGCLSPSFLAACWAAGK